MFQGSDQLRDNMQKVLVDLIELHVQGKQAHWNLLGSNFRDLHLQLDEIIDSAREFSDEVAERMRALHGMPDGRSETVTATTSLKKYPSDEVDTAKVVDRPLASWLAGVQGGHSASTRRSPGNLSSSGKVEPIASWRRVATRTAPDTAATRTISGASGSTCEASATKAAARVTTA